MPTSAATAAIPSALYATPRSGSGVSSSSTPDFDEGRFLPGAMLAERYRILGPLGKGGMGEVYRANDLRLGQTVALKFLPEAAAQDPATLARFYNEVRIARQVTHPNVCRVYDIGEVDGQPFLSMQFVDGENLASLLLRIGRLPVDKAVEIARRLCAGLAAAHSQGVMHRDLKPANIMIDGRGQVLIADFGLAGLADQITGADIASGTPAYMSPEQLAGKEVTIKSDIYALGLVIYEMFTGKRAFQADTLAELIRLREESRPAEISSVVRDVDPAIGRIIAKCLDPDPQNRPASALAVSAALPGGDPLAAALAAGETPSPEMVAAAGAQEGFRPLAAILCLGAILVALSAVMFLNSHLMLLPKVNLELPPEALAVQARKTLQQLGYTNPVVDESWGFNYDNDYLGYLEQHANRESDWASLANGRPAPVLFWYRQSPTRLEPAKIGGPIGRVSMGDPPAAISGMAGLTLDPMGRLEGFSAVPPQLDQPSAPGGEPDPTAIFAAAGLDLKAFKPVAPQWTPLAATDARAAWLGSFPGHPENPIRVEAAWWHGKPVYLQIVGPWTKPARMPEGLLGSSGNYIFLALSLFTISAGSSLAWRNFRLGRGDRQGALRVAGFCLIVVLAHWLLAVHSVLSVWGLFLFTAAAGEGLWLAVQLWVAYMAIEPAVRRRWPRVLISWTRLLSGRWRDPMVGRDVLIGIAVGLGWDLILAVFHEISLRRGGGPETGTMLDQLIGFRPSIAIVLNRVLDGLVAGLLFFLLFFVLRTILRKEWLAGVTFAVLFAFGQGIGSSDRVLSVAAGLVVFGMVIPVLLRFGLLSLVVTIFVTDLVVALGFTTNFSAWYGIGSLTLTVTVAGLALVAFRNVLRGQQFLNPLLED